MKIDRLLNIDHINETVSLFAAFVLNWAVRSCPATSTGSNAYDLERVFVTEEELIWKPRIYFQNSSNDILMKSNKFGSEIQVLYVPTTPNRTLFFYWTRAGILTSKCTLNVKYFPYDEQVCDFYFQLQEPEDFMYFGGIYLDEFRVSKDSLWVYLGGVNDTGLVKSTYIQDGIHSYAFIRLKFRRNPYYYTYSLLAPCLILIVTVFGSFLMPPHRSERSLLCCTLVLAFSMAHGNILNEVPETTQRIIFSEFMLSVETVTALVSLFDMLMCTLAKGKRYFRLAFKVNICFMNIPMIRALDFLAFLIVFVIFCIIGFSNFIQFID